jgi:hypothetical protein
LADNVAVTAGAGTNIAADEVVDGVLGTVKVQFVKLMDGTLDGTAKATIKPASTPAAATDPALVVTMSPNGLLPSGLASPANSNPVVVAPQTTRVAVTPTVTASAYTAGNGIGGVMTFANALPGVGFNGILQSIAAKFKGAAVTGSIEVAVFSSAPSGTYTDKTAPTWNTADAAKLIGIYTLSTPNSKLGTMTCYNLDGIGAAFVAAGTSLYAVAIVDGTPTPASTSDFTLELGVLPG